MSGGSPLDLGRAAAVVCALAAAGLLVPIGLTTVGFGALLGPSSTAGTSARVSVPVRLDTEPASAEVKTGFIAPVAMLAQAGGLVPGWAERPALNQYARGSYRTTQMWLRWQDASCSAASVFWLLGAYGRPVEALDDAIELVGPGTGISTAVGLMDARGPALARALARRGLQPRVPGNRPIGSIAELKAWLDRGPLLMDGGRWFGAGHWFVGIGYDANGVFIRDSSGYNNRHLSWSRLYGEVGFSGWVVGVNS